MFSGRGRVVESKVIHGVRKSMVEDKILCHKDESDVDKSELRSGWVEVKHGRDESGLRVDVFL